jgi:hypothetical protein
VTVIADASFGDVLCQFWLVLALVGVPGALGGLTYAISIFLTPAAGESGRSPASLDISKLWFCVANAVIGIGGSLAALLVILGAKRFPDPLVKLDNLLGLACMGYVSGYIANRLLPAIADRFYKQLMQLTEEHAELAKKTEKGIDNAVDLSTTLTGALDYLRERSFVSGQTEKLIVSLTVLVQQYPTNRTLNVVLSRLWDEADGSRGKALDVLGNFIKAKLAAGERDEDLATAYWNTANYYEFDFKELKTPSLRAHAVEALRKALELSPSYLKELRQDQDFASLLKTEEGMRLLKDFNAPEGS